MKFTKLIKRKQFEKLQKGDVLLVQWSDYSVKHTPGCKEFMLYQIHENKAKDNEIICRVKGNHYFNYDRYLENLSWAEDVYLIEGGN